MSQSVKRAASMLSVGLAAALVAAPASADVVLVNDTFDTAGPATGWYSIKGMTGISAGPGSNSMVGESVFIGDTVAALNLVARPFTAVTLANVGDSISVSFDFQLIGTFGTSNPVDHRPAFGLYNSNGPQVAADDEVAKTLADFGYQARFYTASSSSTATLAHESGVANDGPLEGTDPFTVVTDATFTASQRYDLRHYELILTRVLNGSDPAVHMDLTVTDPDGSIADFNLQGTVPSSRFIDTLDTFYLRSNNVDYQLDNVQITYVPEPGSVALLAAGGVMFLRRRRAD